MFLLSSFRAIHLEGLWWILKIKSFRFRLLLEFNGTIVSRLVSCGLSWQRLRLPSRWCPLWHYWSWKYQWSLQIQAKTWLFKHNSFVLCFGWCWHLMILQGCIPEYLPLNWRSIKCQMDARTNAFSLRVFDMVLDWANLIKSKPFCSLCYRTVGPTSTQEFLK